MNLQKNENGMSDAGHTLKMCNDCREESQGNRSSHACFPYFDSYKLIHTNMDAFSKARHSIFTHILRVRFGMGARVCLVCVWRGRDVISSIT